MRLLAVLTAATLLAGCTTTTRVIDASWDEATIAEMGRQAPHVSSVHVGSDSRAITATRGFEILGDTVALVTDVLPTWAEPYAVRWGISAFHSVRLPATDVREITIVGWDRTAGVPVGALSGAVLLGLVAATVSNGFCSDGDSGRDNCVWQTLEGGLVGAVAGAAVGGFLGILNGTKETTIYRFNGGSISATPSGASVTIDVGR